MLSEMKAARQFTRTTQRNQNTFLWPQRPKQKTMWQRELSQSQLGRCRNGDIVRPAWGVSVLGCPKAQSENPQGCMLVVFVRRESRGGVKIFCNLRSLRLSVAHETAAPRQTSQLGQPPLKETGQAPPPCLEDSDPEEIWPLFDSATVSRLRQEVVRPEVARSTHGQ
jgi:hypothetical protein